MGRLESGSRRLRRTHPTHPSPFLEHTHRLKPKTQNHRSSVGSRCSPNAAVALHKTLLKLAQSQARRCCPRPRSLRPRAGGSS